MHVFVAGASGALGRPLLPLLLARGHAVTGMTRSASGGATVRALGAVPAVADALDAEAVTRAVAAARPDVVVHQLTALSGGFGSRPLDEAMAPTNRLRTEGTAHLLAAAEAAGVGRVVAQSYAGSGLPFARVGAWVKGEDAPLDPAPPNGARETVRAIRALEAAVTGAAWAEGLVLRYGGFYGPGTAFAPGGEFHAAIRRRAFPVVGSGAGVWSFVHVADAAEATALAVERGAPGVYHITDDAPAAVAEWLPAAAAMIGAKPPRRVPRWLGRWAAGEAVAVSMTEGRGASNAKAGRALGWRPARSWRDALMGDGAEGPRAGAAA